MKSLRFERTFRVQDAVAKKKMEDFQMEDDFHSRGWIQTLWIHWIRIGFDPKVHYCGFQNWNIQLATESDRESAEEKLQENLLENLL